MSIRGWVKAKVVPDVAEEHGDVRVDLDRADRKMEDIERRLESLRKRVEVVSQK